MSDDDDLLTAYEVAQKELQGNLKFSVAFKSENATEIFDPELYVKKREKREKKATKETTKKKVKKVKKTNKPSDEVYLSKDTAKTLD